MSKAAFEKKLGGIKASVLDRLVDFEKQTMIVRPADSFTVKEYAASRGIDKVQAIGNLERLRRAGKVKRHKAEGSNQVFWTIAS